MDIESIVFMIGCATATYRNGVVILLLVVLSDFNSAHDSFLYGEQCYWEWGILFLFSFSTRPSVTVDSVLAQGYQYRF